MTCVVCKTCLFLCYQNRDQFKTTDGMGYAAGTVVKRLNWETRKRKVQIYQRSRYGRKAVQCAPSDMCICARYISGFLTALALTSELI